MVLSLNGYAQGPGSLFINAGPDVAIDCDDSSGCTDITADFLEIFETISEEYTVTSIPYNPPFPFDGLANPLNPNIDDAWSSVDDLPFDFCFFGNLETQFQVGSNGVLRFDVDPGDTSNGWSFTENLPNNSNPTLGEANVFTPVHDIDPSVSNTEEIGYEVLGTYPNRVLVVSYFEVPMFSGACNNLLATHMAVFYEFSNVIEIYIQDKPVCPGWNSGNAALGIQNNDGTIAYVPPGRNTSDSPWTATNEAWRFAPDGVETFVFEWLNSDGDVIGTTPTINVCPDGSEVYTARITYTNTCNGEVVVLTDDVTVSTVATFSVDLGGDQQFCDEESYDITAEVIDGDPADATFLWSTGETTQTITVTTSGAYSVEVTIDDCSITESVNIVLEETPDIELGADIETCFEEEVILDASPSNYDPLTATYEWSLDGTVIPGETSPTLEVTQIGTYSVIVTVGNCVATDSVEVTTKDLIISLGEDIVTCFDSPVVLDASPSNYDPTLATYEWSVDGNIIPGETQPTLVVTGAGVYSVIVTGGICTGQDSISITPSDDLIVSLGDDFQTCRNEPQTLTATTTEDGVTYQWLLNGAVIPNETDNTLDIVLDGSDMGTQNYTVIISSGDCTGSDDIAVSFYDVGNCTISQGISPDGSPGFNDSLDLTFLNDRSGIAKLQIFNRQGLLVFERTNYTNEWIGQSKDGNELPTGTYFYVIDLNANDPVYNNQATGWIYLNRDAN